MGINMGGKLGEALTGVVFNTILENETLLNAAAEKVAEAIVAKVPDVAEDSLGRFMELVGEKIREANP